MKFHYRINGEEIVIDSPHLLDAHGQFLEMSNEVNFTRELPFEGDVGNLADVQEWESRMLVRCFVGIG